MLWSVTEKFQNATRCVFNFFYIWKHNYINITYIKYKRHFECVPRGSDLWPSCFCSSFRCFYFKISALKCLSKTSHSVCHRYSAWFAIIALVQWHHQSTKRSQLDTSSMQSIHLLHCSSQKKLLKIRLLSFILCSLK